MKSGNRRDVSEFQKTITRFSDQALAYSAKEIFGIGVRFFHEGGFVAEFHFDFLQRQLYRDFWLVAALYQHLSPVREGVVGGRLCVFVGYGKAGFGFTLVVAKFR